MIARYRHGARHSPNDAAPHLLAGAIAGPGVSPLPRRDWFGDLAPADGEMLLNDQLGCCVQVARNWWIKAWIASTEGRALEITDGMILQSYELAGYRPGEAASDRGTDTSQDMLRWQAEPQLDIEGTPHAIWWAKIDPRDDLQLATALSRVPCLTTVFLPDAVEQDVESWGRAPGSGTGWDPNPDNAHRLMVGRFDGRDRWVNTWGMHPYVHPDFWKKYIADPVPDGFDVPVPRRMTDPMGLDWAGINLSALANQAQAITG